MAGADASGRAVGDPGRRRVFDTAMYAVHVQGWPDALVHPERPISRRITAPEQARLRIHPIDPHDRRPLPTVEGSPPGPTVAGCARFVLGNSGNRTLGAPKRSWKVTLQDPGDAVEGMSRLNLKSMYNDPSQMREALVWELFARAGVRAPRHTFARLGINGRYLGLFSLIESVDEAFIGDRFGDRRRGNLYKVFCGDLGPGTLEHRVGPDGDDSGRQYTTTGADPTYRLRSWSHQARAGGHDDLARFVRVINGVSLPGGDERFAGDAWAEQVREIFDVEGFLRWASVNVLVGGWDNYFATPANYYLYNGGRGPGSPELAAAPYFTWIPWDYDNTLGIDYVGSPWQYTDLLDWPSATERYWGHGRRSRLPLVQNVLRNARFRRYYLDHLEYLLDTCFHPEAIGAAIGGTQARGDGSGLWGRIAPSAYLESDTPFGAPFTGRQYSNDEVYRAGHDQLELRHARTFVLGIEHYVRMRYDSARAQLRVVRRADPAGSGGGGFAAPRARSRPA